MKTHKIQSGFTLVEALLILVIVAIIGVVGLKVLNTQQDVAEVYSTASSSAASKSGSDAVPAVNKASDLDRVGQTLDSVNPDSSSSDNAQLDSQLATF